MQAVLKRTLAGLGAAAVALSFATAASAQDYPNSRITILVGASAGGYVDSVARITADYLTKTFGQTVVVENRAGAAQNIAARAAASAAPDGYTILAATTGVAVNATLYKSIDYKLLEDLRAVAVPVAAPEQFSVNPERPHTMKDFLEAAKTKRMKYGSAGIGSGSYLAMYSFFKNVAKIEIDHVPFPGGAPAIQATIGGQIDGIAATAAGVTVKQVQAGTIICLGVAAAERFKNLPDCPTFAEQGFGNFEAASWVGFFVPAGTPDAVAEKLNAAISAAIDDPETNEKLSVNGVLTKRSLAESKAFVASEVESWGERVKAAGAQIE